jgi:hypothetical protein
MGRGVQNVLVCLGRELLHQTPFSVLAHDFLHIARGVHHGANDLCGIRIWKCLEWESVSDNEYFAQHGFVTP